MLEIAGGQNVFGDVARESVQPSSETLIARAPDVILEVRTAGLLEEREVAQEQGVWSALPSLPAVRNKRVHFLVGDFLVVPGPRLAQATEAFAAAIHQGAAR
jgi:iron complex transport system substrate-binding protein